MIFRRARLQRVLSVALSLSLSQVGQKRRRINRVVIAVLETDEPQNTTPSTYSLLKCDLIMTVTSDPAL